MTQRIILHGEPAFLKQSPLGWTGVLSTQLHLFSGLVAGAPGQQLPPHHINLVEKVIRKAIEEFQDNSFAKVISKLNEKYKENLKEKPKTVKTDSEALYGPIRRVRPAPSDGHSLGLKDVRLSKSGLLGHVSYLTHLHL